MTNPPANLIPRASPSPPSLDTLPTEILTLSCSFMDKNTALIFARTSRRFNSSAETRIWRDLDLAPQRYYGVYPLITPYAEYDSQGRESSSFRTWAREEAKAEEARKTAGLKRRLRTIMSRIDEGRAGMVRRVRIIPQEGVTDNQVQMLELVSTGLNILEIHSIGRYPSCFYSFSMPDIDYRDTLDARLLSNGLQFPALTHVRITERAIYCIGTLSLLLSSAPCLVSLDVDSDLHFTSDNQTAPKDAYPVICSATKLRAFRFSSEVRDDDDVPQDDDLLRILAIVDLSPLLRKLSLQTGSYNDERKADQVAFFKSMRALPELQDPQLTIDLVDLGVVCEGELLSAIVRRLALYAGQWWHICQYLPLVPSIQALYLIESHSSANALRPPTPDISLNATYPHSMTPQFAMSLRLCPQLRFIYTFALPLNEETHELDHFSRFDEIERQGDFTGVIRSLKHEGGELLHARMLGNYLETADRPLSDDHQTDIDVPGEFAYFSADGTNRLKTFNGLPTLTWIDYTCYEGLQVPLSVICEMQLVEGAEEKDWEGRGIEVGAAAWKVLTDWRDGIMAASEGGVAVVEG